MNDVLDANGFAGLFGVPVSDISIEEQTLISRYDFRFRRPDRDKRDEIILHVLNRLEKGDFSVSGEMRRGDWEKGWSENLEEFIRSKHDLDTLVPKYVRPDQPLRLQREYVLPNDPRFELHFYTVFRNWLFRRYFREERNIYEFGCGTGYNLVILSELYPEKRLYGLDWAQASVELVDRIAASHSKRISGILFDMYRPDAELSIEPGSAFLSLNSIEQLGTEHEKLLQFFLAKKPSICIHAEPLYELYDENHLLDYLAMKYHEKRGYLRNFVSRLRQLESEGKVTILKTLRVPFGSLFHEGYSLILWKPAS